MARISIRGSIAGGAALGMRCMTVHDIDSTRVVTFHLRGGRQIWRGSVMYSDGKPHSMPASWARWYATTVLGPA